MTNPLNKLQEQPYKVRIRILWGVVVIVAVVLTVLIVSSIRNTIGNAGENLIKIQSSKFVPDSLIAYASVEWVEQSEKSLKVYFNLNNSGSDILNVPNLSQITLSIGSNSSHPQKITDRQGNQFAQKILSQTQVFGILVFPAPKGTKGTLLFDQMFLEHTPSDIFQQKIPVDLEQLNKGTGVRN